MHGPTTPDGPAPPTGLGALDPQRREHGERLIAALAAAEAGASEAVERSYDAAVALGLVLLDARRWLSAEAHARLVGSVEIEAPLARLAIETAEQAGEAPSGYPMDLAALRRLGAAMTEMHNASSAASNCRHEALLRLGSWLNDLRRSVDAAVYAGVEREADARLSDRLTLLGIVLAYGVGDVRGVVGEDHYALLRGGLEG